MSLLSQAETAKKKKSVQKPLSYNGNDIKLREKQEKELSNITGFHVGDGISVEGVQCELLDPFPENRNIENTDIEHFAENIYRNGFFGTILVYQEHEDDSFTPHDNGRYMILSGHRRAAAVQYILKNLDPDFMHHKIPAFIITKRLQYEKLYELNVTYNLDSKAESVKEQRERVLKLLSFYESKGEKKISAKIAEQMDISMRQTQKYLNVSKNLCKGLLDLLDAGEIDVNHANQYASRSLEAQNFILNKLTVSGSFTDEEYQILKMEDELEKRRIEDARRAILENQKKLLSKEKEIQKLQDNEKVLKEKETLSDEESNDLSETEAMIQESKALIQQMTKDINTAPPIRNQIAERMRNISMDTSVSDSLSKINGHVIRLKKRAEAGNYSFSEHDKQKIRSLIDDLSSML